MSPWQRGNTKSSGDRGEGGGRGKEVRKKSGLRLASTLKCGLEPSCLLSSFLLETKWVFLTPGESPGDSQNLLSIFGIRGERVGSPTDLPAASLLCLEDPGRQWGQDSRARTGSALTSPRALRRSSSNTARESREGSAGCLGGAHQASPPRWPFHLSLPPERNGGEGRRFSGADVEGGPDRDHQTDNKAPKRGTEGAQGHQRTSGAVAAAPKFCIAGTERKLSGWLQLWFSAPCALLRALAP